MKARVIFASRGLIVGTAIPAVAATFDDSSAPRLVDDPSSDPTSPSSTPVDGFDGIDISGNRDEAEHANDPECNGTAPARIDDDSSRDDNDSGRGRGRGRGRGGDDDSRDDSDDD